MHKRFILKGRDKSNCNISKTYEQFISKGCDLMPFYMNKVITVPSIGTSWAEGWLYLGHKSKLHKVFRVSIYVRKEFKPSSL